MLAHINRDAPGGEARLSNDWQHAIVASFPGTPLDEAAFAQKVAQHAGSEAQVLESRSAALPERTAAHACTCTRTSR
jgi:hypothetical protein